MRPILLTLGFLIVVLPASAKLKSYKIESKIYVDGQVSQEPKVVATEGYWAKTEQRSHDRSLVVKYKVEENTNPYIDSDVKVRFELISSQGTSKMSLVSDRFFQLGEVEEVAFGTFHTIKNQTDLKNSSVKIISKVISL